MTRFAVAQDGARLAYEEHGGGEPLLLHSGANYDRRTWSGVRDDLAERYRLVLFDQRGNGDSDKGLELAYDPGTLARDVLAVLDACGIDRAHLGGLSRGGRIVLQVAAEHPERVATLLLVSTSPGGLQDAPVDPQLQAQPLMAKLYSAEWLAGHTEVSAEQREVMAGSTAEVRAKRAAAASHDLWSALPNVRAPVLVLHGTADGVIHPRNAELMAERLPNARLVLVPGGRHGMHREYRDEVLAAMTDFLREHPIERTRAGEMVRGQPGD